MGGRAVGGKFQLEVIQSQAASFLESEFLDVDVQRVVCQLVHNYMGTNVPKAKMLE